MGVEDSAFKVGGSVVLLVTKEWTDNKAAQKDQASSLSDLLKVGLRDRFHQRDLGRQLEQIGDEVAKRLTRMAEVEFKNEKTNELAAALDALDRTLSQADLSDQSIFAVNASPLELAQAIRTALPSIPSEALLSDGATAYYRVCLDEACSTIATLVRRLPEFNSRAAVEILRRLSELTEQVHRLPRVSLDAPEGEEQDFQFRARYLEYIGETLDELEIFGVDAQRYRPRTLVSVAYMNLEVTESSALRQVADLGPSWSEQYRTSTPLSGVRAETVLARAKRVLLRGEAGSGKTTLLQWLAVNCARASFEGALTPWNGSTPFLVKLRNYTGDTLPTPDQFLSNAAAPLADYMPRAWVHRELLRRNCVLLVDGVDETPSNQRRQVRTWLKGLLAAYPDMTVLVTSRPAAASADWLRSDDFHSLALDPMRASDVAAFCYRWHEAVRDAVLKGFAELPFEVEQLDSYYTSLLRQLESRRHLQSLATNPLLCALICALNLSRRQQLPPDRMALYEAALRLLIDRRDAERRVPAASETTLDSESKIILLQRLAWRLTTRGRAEMSRDDAIEHVRACLERLPDIKAEPSEALQYLLERSGLLREPVPGRIDFVHKTFQEYLAGKEAAEDQWFEELVSNAHKDQWRETVVMATGHASMPGKSRIILGIVERAHLENPRRARTLRLVAVSCRDACRSLEPEVVSALEAEIDEVVPPRTMREVRSLVQAGAAVLRHLPQDTADLALASARACVQAAAHINGDDGISVLQRYASDSRKEVQRELISAWRYFDPFRYADEVLRDAALVNGRAFVGDISRAQAASSLVNLTSLRVSLVGQGHDSAWLKNVRELTELEVHGGEIVDLKLLSAASAGLTSLTAPLRGTQDNLKQLHVFDQLERLDISFPHGSVGSLDFISDLSTKIAKLWLSDTTRPTDFSPVTHLANLRDLTLFSCKKMASADFLSQLHKLEELYLAEAQLTDVDLLSNFPSALRELFLINLPQVRSLELLSSDLERLTVAGCPIADWTPLRGMENLEHLTVGEVHSFDLGVVAQLPKLRMLTVRQLSELNISRLADCTQPLLVRVHGMPGLVSTEEVSALPDHIVVHRV